MTPGRRMISRRGAAGSGGASPVASSSPIRFGSGRTRGEHERHQAEARGGEPGMTSESPRARARRTAAETAGPRIAPKTAPNRTSAIPRAGARAGTCRRPPCAEQRRRAAVPRGAGPGDGGGESIALPSAASEQPARPSAKPPARTGTRPKRSIARPAGSAVSAPERGRSPARARAGPRRRTTHERQRGDGRRRAGASEFAASAREQRGVAANRGGEVDRRLIRFDVTPAIRDA